MTLGSLFDGSGGFPLAGALCGIEPVWASEIEPFPIAVTSQRFPNMKHLGDVNQIDGHKIQPVDIISLGSPCQDLSLAGRQEGLKGSRSNLFFQAIRIIEEMMEETNGKYPQFALWENVPGALTSNKGADFRAVLQAFADIRGYGLDTIPQPAKWKPSGGLVGHGFSVAWRILDAQFWGVPARRRRIFCVCDFRGNRAGEILFKREGLQRDYHEGSEAWKGAARYIAGIPE